MRWNKGILRNQHKPVDLGKGAGQDQIQEESADFRSGLRICLVSQVNLDPPERSANNAEDRGVPTQL
jgi:hypothetical protein